MSTGIGDVKSSARGSGARYNDGKPPLELVPMQILLEAYKPTQREVADTLHLLHEFQFTHRKDILVKMLWILSPYVEDCARVFDYGRKKYAEWNWLKGMPWSVPLGCAARHLLAISRGEEIDSESGLLHMGHVMCNIVMLRTYMEMYPEGNDLPTIPEATKDE